jgi:hypothetical protein
VNTAQQLSCTLRRDVRILRNCNSNCWGFERNGRILWLPKEFNHVDLSRSEQLAKVVGLIGVALRQNAFVEDAPTKVANAGDRNFVFLQALVGASAAHCTHFLDSTEFLIIGCGGLGASIAVQLAAMGARHFLLVDGDSIEESNLNRLLFASRSDVGQRKVNVLASHLEHRFGAVTTPVPQFMHPGLTLPFQQHLRFAVITVDNPLAGQAAVRFLHEQPFTPYIHAGYSGSRCVVGPLVDGQDCACPFCGSEELELVLTGEPAASPSTAVNNQLTAGLVVTQLLKWSVDIMDARARHVLDLNSLQLFSEVPRQPGCAVCTPDR